MNSTSADQNSLDSGDPEQELARRATSVSWLKAILLFLLAAPVVVLVGLIATNGFTEGSPGVALIGLGFGLAVAAPFCLPILVLLYLQHTSARDQNWNRLRTVSVLLTICDILLLLVAIPQAINTLANLQSDGGALVPALSIGLAAVAGVLAWRQWAVTTRARRQRTAPTAAVQSWPPPIGPT